MKKNLFICVLCFVVFGCASSSVQQSGRVMGNPGDNIALADSLVAGIINNYRNFSRDTFEEAISPDFTPMRSEFINQVEQSSLSGQVFSIDYFIDEALRHDNKLSVKIKWEKKTQPYASTSPVLTEGKGFLVFIVHNDRWQLQQVSGDNPL